MTPEDIAEVRKIVREEIEADKTPQFPFVRCQGCGLVYNSQQTGHRAADCIGLARMMGVVT